MTLDPTGKMAIANGAVNGIVCSLHFC